MIKLKGRSGMATGTGVAVGGVVSSAISSPEQEYEMAVASFVAFLQPLAKKLR